MKKIGIIGHGYVGKAIEEFFKNHHDIKIYDPGKGSNNKKYINKCDLAVICVPTPEGKSGVVDLSAIYDTFSWLNTPLVLIKSTIPPGTTEKLTKKHKLHKKVAFSPEYIGEGKYFIPFWKNYPHPTDMKMHNFFIFGGGKEATKKIIEFFKCVTGPDAQYFQTDSTTAELTKYMSNAWGAMKISFCNEFYEIARTLGVDYNELRELWLLDGRVERMHTLVFEENRGFSGKCLPKDLSGIVNVSKKIGYKPHLLEQIIKSNRKFRLNT